MLTAMTDQVWLEGLNAAHVATAAIVLNAFVYHARAWNQERKSAVRTAIRLYNRALGNYAAAAIAFLSAVLWNLMT